MYFACNLLFLNLKKTCSVMVNAHVTRHQLVSVINLLFQLVYASFFCLADLVIAVKTYYKRDAVAAMYFNVVCL